MTPNRLATLLAVVAGIITAVVPAVANMDWTSTAGVVSGCFAAVVAVVKWLDGWQKHEATEAHKDAMAQVYGQSVVSGPAPDSE